MVKILISFNYFNEQIGYLVFYLKVNLRQLNSLQ